jgi:hypothetical protein
MRINDTLTREQKLRLVAELCPKSGRRRPCDSFELARDRALEILGSSDRATVTADYVLMKAIDRYTAGQLTVEELYRCRILAYYMTFANGGEEWARWGVAADVRPGEFTSETELPELEELLPPVPEGPPWRSG